jgi:4-amino-4-deoxy-L-arabinose transferase-like glycosyltransferase
MAADRHAHRRLAAWGPLALGILLLFGMHLRSVYLLETEVVQPFAADAGEYYLYAHNLRHHGVYSRDPRGLTENRGSVAPDAVRSPGYPLFIALFMGDAPPRAVLGRVLFAQAVLSTLAAGLAYVLFRRLLGEGWGLAAAALTALSPHLVVVSGYLLTETLFLFLLLAAGLALAALAETPGWRSGLLLGALLAAASLVRPSLQYFPLVIALWACLRYGRPQGVRAAAAIALGFVLVTAPWWARNLSAFGRLSDNTLMIGSVHHGIYPGFMYNRQPETFGFPYRYDPRTPEISRNLGSVLEEIGGRFAREPGEHAAWFLVGKPMALWSWDIVQGQGDVFIYPVSRSPYADDPLFQSSHRWMRRLHIPLAVLCGLGCLMVWLPAASRILDRRALDALRLLSLVPVYFTLVHIATAPFPRYSIPLRPFQYGMAAAALFMVWRLIAIRKSSSAGAGQPSER